ncbi:MAG: VWA domain-containing protein [Mycobacterium sp.]
MTLHPVLPLAVLAVVAGLLAAGQIVALRRWQAGNRHRASLWRWLGMTAAAVLLLVAAARPVIVDADQAASRTAGSTEPNVFLVVDRSPDMSVRDLDDRTRMEIARADIEALIDRYPGARFAVIGFASAPSLDWPLSADTWSLRPVMDAITPYAFGPDTVTQTNAGAANTVLRYQLITAAQQYPRARNLVFYLGAGAPESYFPAREFDPPAGSVDGGGVLGYGTAAGGPIPGTETERSAVDDPVLRGVAEQLGVPFVPRSDAAPLAGVLPDDRDSGGSAASVATTDGQTETYWLPALGAAVLILVELYLVLRAFRRSRLVGVDVLP